MIDSMTSRARTAPAWLVSLIEAMPEPHALCDQSYRILAANPAYRALFESGDSPVGRTCHDISHGSPVPCDQAGEVCPLALALESGQRQRIMHLHAVREGQQYVQVEITPLTDPDTGAVLFLERMEPVHVAHAAGSESRLVGKAPAFRKMLELVTRVAPSEANVLLLGESGSGKEIVAHAIQEASPRSSAPFVVVECASLAESLFESELFGHEKGAFTGAVSARKGLVESADGGTLFLDEVGDIPLGMQVKLLRLIETGCFRRVGSTELRCTDVRIVSATHRDLAQMASQDLFRKDLLYRIGGFPIRIPSLRERRSDIEPLSRVLMSRFLRGKKLTITPGAMEALRSYNYPGNVRELRNILERASLLCDGEKLTEVHIRTAIGQSAWVLGAPDPARDQAGLHSTPGAEAGQTLKDAETRHLLEALHSHGGDKKALATSLGISERTLYRKLQIARNGNAANK